MRANGFTRNIATRRAACPLAYGGSAKATSYWPGCSCSANRTASTRCTAVRSSTLSVVMLALRVASADRWVHEVGGQGPAGQRLEPERSRAREQVQDAGAAHRALQDRKPRFAHAVAGGANRIPGGRLQAATLELAGDYP